MTKPEKTRVEEWIVVVLDMTSSSDILDDLTLTRNTRRFKTLLTSIKSFIRHRQNTLELAFKLYKFTGDGWILLFPTSIQGPALMKFLAALLNHFRCVYERSMRRVLNSPPERATLRFGADSGELLTFIMAGRREYVGRAINVAQRLQQCAGDDEHPHQVVFSSQALERLNGNMEQYEPIPVTRPLKNIRNGKPFQCVKLLLPERCTSGNGS